MAWHALPAGSQDQRRTLIVSHAAELGGAELALLRLIDALPPQERSQLSFACLTEGDLASHLRDRGLDVDVVPMALRTRTLTRNELLHPRMALQALGDTFSVVRALARTARERADIIQSASMKAHLLTVPVALLSGRRLVWYVHDRIENDYLPGPVVLLVRLLSRLPTAVVVNSLATAATIPRETIVVHPGFTADQALSATQVDERTAPRRPAFTLLGRISPTKGQLEFVQAAKLVEQSHPGCDFRIVGEPMFEQQAYAEDVAAYAHHHGLPVTWVGFADDPTSEIDRATAMVHASPTPEPFGQVILEACVRGVPVIATKAGGVAEIVGEDGYLVPPGDVEALAAAMRRVLDHPSEARARARAAYARTVQEFPIERTARRMSSLWDQLRSGGSPSLK